MKAEKLSVKDIQVVLLKIRNFIDLVRIFPTDHTNLKTVRH